MQVRLGFWALAPTRSTPSAPHERAGQEAKSHISPRCNYVSSRERDVCMYRGDVSEIPYMYAVAWRDGGFEGFRALACTFTVPLVLASCWICWITRPDLRQRCRRAFGWGRTVGAVAAPAGRHGYRHRLDRRPRDPPPAPSAGRASGGGELRGDGGVGRIDDQLGEAAQRLPRLPGDLRRRPGRAASIRHPVAAGAARRRNGPRRGRRGMAESRR